MNAKSPPRKKRVLAVVVTPAGRDSRTEGMEIPKSLDSAHPELPRSPQLRGHTASLLGSKRSRDAEGSLLPRARPGRRSADVHGVGAPPMDKSTVTDSLPSATTPVATDKTLAYETECSVLLRTRLRDCQRCDLTSSPSASCRSSASISPTPARRQVVLLTSTPQFVREARDAAANAGNRSPASIAVQPSSVLPASTPVGFVRAAWSVSIPTGATLRRRISFLRRSVDRLLRPPQGPTTTTTTTQGGCSSPPLPSPWGRISSIVATHESLPSVMDRSSGGCLRDDCVGQQGALFAQGLRGHFSAEEHHSLHRSPKSSVQISIDRGRARRAGEVPPLLRNTVPPESLILDDGADEGTSSHARQLSPTVMDMGEMRDASESLPRSYGGGSFAHPYHFPPKDAVLGATRDIRFARVSSLSGSLAEIVSSSRSTARSSLTSVTAAAASSAGALSGVSSAGHLGGNGKGAAPVLRHSATLLDPNVSSILPDEEEAGIRRRLRRVGYGSYPCTKSAGYRDVAPTTASDQHLFHPSKGPDPPGKVMGLSVKPASLPSLNCAKWKLSARRGNEGDEPSSVRTAGATIPDTITTHHQTFRSRRRFELSTVPSPMQIAFAKASRLFCALMATVICLWCLLVAVWPLAALQRSRDTSQSWDIRSVGALPTTSSSLYTAATGAAAAAAEAFFLNTHVNPVADLQALYRVSPASLDAEAVARLQHRILSEGVERLERATQHLAPDDNTPPTRRLIYYRQMIKAYLALSRNSELYARSRDTNVWRRWVTYPLADMSRYGLRRLSLVAAQLTVAPSAGAAWWDRIATTLACSAQSELLPCPSELYVEEAMARDAAQFIYTDVNEQHESLRRRRRLQDWRLRLKRDWSSEVYLETLLNYIRIHTQELTRGYNR